ncbi:MAG: GspL/Epsl periplasmic domain-containing protein, partial [Candidatus Competibacteraceae bacterium]|nr:GspL/Epsl periplasmic domain-containing protein [Candidatus Competibacteraceae bacterium]
TLARGESGSAAGFLELLYRGGQTLTAFEDIALKGLRYRNDRLDLDLEGGSLETFDRLKQSLGQQPGMETQMRTSRREDRIQSQVTLRVAS